jgi:hypothetical protein
MGEVGFLTPRFLTPSMRGPSPVPPLRVEGVRRGTTTTSGAGAGAGAVGV